MRRIVPALAHASVFLFAVACTPTVSPGSQGNPGQDQGVIPTNPQPDQGTNPPPPPPPRIDAGVSGCTPKLDAGLSCPYTCYGGWVCDHATGHCVAPGTLPDAGSCGNPPPPPPPPTDAGTRATDSGIPMTPPGAIGPTGGTVNLLAFAVIGDVRPGSLDATSSYPTAIITSIFQGIQALNAQFVLGTGDYMFADNASDVSAQVADLLSAKKAYSGFVAFAMGNHECTGYTSSNCPNGTETPNVQAFMSQLIPFSAKPYYYFIVHTSLGDAKFINIAANAWSMAQQSWLQATLAIPSKYTFVARHEPTSGTGTTAPGEGPSQTLINAASPPVTLQLWGHTHEYSHYSTNQVISGNSGAPLTSGSYGYLYVVQRADGNVSVTEYNEGTNTPGDSWAVTPTGSSTP